MIVTMIPYCPTEHGANLGFAYNAQMERLRDDDWACFIDHDACFTTREWYPQLEAITKSLTTPALLTAKTNRVGSPWQLVAGVDVSNHSMEYHRRVGDRIIREFGLKLKGITAADGYMSGVVILLSKKTWKLLGGFANGFLGVDTELHKTAIANRIPVYLMEGVYVYHWYRADTAGQPTVARNLSEFLPDANGPIVPGTSPQRRTTADCGVAEQVPMTAADKIPAPIQATESVPGTGPMMPVTASASCADEWQSYQEAVRLALSGELDVAKNLYHRLQYSASDPRQKAMIENDLAALFAADGSIEAALAGFEKALSFDKVFATARENIETLSAVMAQRSPTAPGQDKQNPTAGGGCGKVAVLSFLFNWPSTGGGIIHTVELVQALSRAGYGTKHFFFRDPDGMVGTVDPSLPIPSVCIAPQKGRCTREEIKMIFRRAVDDFAPDWVIITDCWNFKPHLAEAISHYPYFLRFQAMECLCPLNNLRLLVGSGGSVQQCPKHQLASPDACRVCLEANSSRTGRLHQWERTLSNVGSSEYLAALYQAIAKASAILVLNPLVAEMIRPYANRVEVVTWGMDAARFPWPLPESKPRNTLRKTLLMAGMVPELIKGFHVLHDACEILWKKRQDFELHATGEPVGQLDEFTRLIGWKSQAELPQCIRDADVLVMPTIAQEGLARSTVEAMAVGRPVIASRIGGLPYTVTDGLTGLLFEPGNASDLAEKIETILDNPDLCIRMGAAGRKRFEADFTWNTVIENQYRPLLKRQMDQGRKL